MQQEVAEDDGIAAPQDVAGEEGGASGGRERSDTLKSDANGGVGVGAGGHGDRPVTGHSFG